MWEIQGLEKKVKATGAGSASPVVSSRMASWGVPRTPARAASSRSAPTMSLRSEQQTQPRSIDTRSSLDSRFSTTAGTGRQAGRKAGECRPTFRCLTAGRVFTEPP